MLYGLNADDQPHSLVSAFTVGATVLNFVSLIQHDEVDSILIARRKRRVASFNAYSTRSHSRTHT